MNFRLIDRTLTTTELWNAADAFGGYSEERFRELDEIRAKVEMVYPTFMFAKSGGISSGYISVYPGGGVDDKEVRAICFFTQQDGSLKAFEQTDISLMLSDDDERSIAELLNDKRWVLERSNLEKVFSLPRQLLGTVNDMVDSQSWGGRDDLRVLDPLFTQNPDTPSEYVLSKWAFINEKFGFELSEQEVAFMARAEAHKEHRLTSQLKETVPLDVINSFKSSEKVTASMVAFYSAEGDRGTYRRQAVEAYPLLAELFTQELSMRFTIDRGASLKEVLATRFDVAPGALKRLRKVVYEPRFMPAEHLAAILVKLDGSQIPKDETEWMAFCELAAVAAKEIGPLSGQKAEEVLTAAKGNWAEYSQAVAQSSGIDTYKPGDGQLLDIASLLPEISKICTDRAVYPMMWSAAFGGNKPHSSYDQESAMRAFANTLLYGGLNMRDVFEKITRFHNNAVALNAVGCVARDESEFTQTHLKEWPTLTDEIVAPNGYILRPLPSNDDLVKEGRAMNHCIGSFGYDKRACEGRAGFYSIRYPDGKRASTLHFDMDRSSSTGNMKYTLQQNRAVRNARPVKGAAEAGDWFIEQVNHGGIETNIDAIQNHGRIVKGGLAELPYDARCGYETNDFKALNEVYTAWRDIFTKKHSKTPLSKITNSEEFKETLKQINHHADVGYNFSRVARLQAAS